MLPVLGINLKTGFNGKVQQNQNQNQNVNQTKNLYQSKPDTVSFSGKEKVVKSAESKLIGFLSEIFEANFKKEGNKFLSEEPIPFYEIEDNKEFFQMIQEGKTDLLKGFKKKEDLGIFVQQAYDLLMLKSLVFTGAEGKIYKDSNIGAIGSKFSVTLLPQTKINSTLISNDLKEVLNKEFAKNNDVLDVKFEKEKYTLKNERMYQDDPDSPMRYLIIEKN